MSSLSAHPISGRGGMSSAGWNSSVMSIPPGVGKPPIGRSTGEPGLEGALDPAGVTPPEAGVLDPDPGVLAPDPGVRLPVETYPWVGVWLLALAILSYT